MNGKRQSEGSLNGAVCGYFGCPVALFTGDAAAVSEMHEFVTEVEGIVGDPRPLSAIGDALLARPHDEIVVSTLPLGVSRWVKQDLPHRAERQFRLPVTHIVAEPAAKP